MDNIFSGMERAVEGSRIDVDVFGKFVGRDICLKLAHYFVNKITETHHYIPPFNIHTSTKTILINHEKFLLELEMLEPGHRRREFIGNNHCIQTVGVLRGEVCVERFSLENQEAGRSDLRGIDKIKLSEKNIFTFDSEYFSIDSSSKSQVTLLLWLTLKGSVKKIPAVMLFSPAIRTEHWV